MPVCRAALTAAAFLATSGCIFLDIDDGFARFSRDFHFSFPLNAGGRLSVEGFNGGVEITPWERAEIDIDGAKHARSQSQADSLRIDIDHSASSVSVHAVRPADSRGGYGVQFTIKVPRGAVIDRVTTSNGPIHAAEAAGPARLKTSNGAVRAEKFRGDLDIQTSNGPIELDEVEGAVTAHSSNGHIRIDSLRGSLDAETSNSSITAVLLHVDRELRAQTNNGAIDLTMPLGFTVGVHARTSNSSITIRLPEPANSRISARTSNSSVTSDFDTSVHGEISRNSLEGTIGSGGPLLDLSSSNGAIRIVKR
jgi:DUF4097 and DUF4098 domain-containing protein YvlB